MYQLCLLLISLLEGLEYIEEQGLASRKMNPMYMNKKKYEASFINFCLHGSHFPFGAFSVSHQRCSSLWQFLCKYNWPLLLLFSNLVSN